MRFRSIVIENYRQYRDLKLQFEPGEHDLQIIVADNGVGKTNLLNAFTWCLYGEEPHLGSSGKKQDTRQRTEPKLNKEIIEECVERGGGVATVRVVVDIEYEGEQGRTVLRATRSVPFSVKVDGSYFEMVYDSRFSVTWVEGKNRLPLSGEQAQEFLNKLLPESIREYFFFDGEQLDSYFKATGGERIKEAVYSISQIDLFRTMINRLDNVIKQQRRKASSRSIDTNDYEQKLSDQERLAKGCEAFIKEKEAEIEKLEQQLAEVDGQLRGVDDVRDIEKRRDAAQRKADEARAQLTQKRNEYYAFVRDSIVDFYLYPAASGALNSIRSLENEGQLPPAIDPLKLSESLHKGRCVVCQHELSDDDRKHIEELLEQYRVGSETSNILSSMRSELRRTVSTIEHYPAARNRVIRDIKHAAKVLDAAETELRDLDKLAGKYAETSGSIKKLYEDREAYQKQLGECHEQIGTRRNNLKRAQSAITKYKKLLNDALHRNSEASELKRIVDFGEKALKVLKDAEAAVIQETKKNMEQRTEELFKGLVWKESKCDHIELSQNYTPALYDKAGFSCAGTCSAAERSLLALSFTLAMHEVSGFDSPLFIDTPIARASGENRENFARTLVEVSRRKQLILAFTPDEYSESISNEFDSAAATFIRLRLDASESHVMDPEVVVHG